MALLRRTETRVLFLAANVIMAMVFTAAPCAQAIHGVCQRLPGCTIQSCHAKCKSKSGYANALVDCRKTGKGNAQKNKTGKGTALDKCCCFKLLP